MPLFISTFMDFKNFLVFLKKSVDILVQVCYNIISSNEGGVKYGRKN